VLRREGFFFFLGGVVVCSLGGESWDEKEEGEIREERVSRVEILFTFADGITDGLLLSMISSIILTVNWSCHCT
jgi:hypothetical protein